MAGHSASGDPEQFEAETAARGLTDALADLSAGIYGPAYQMERQLQEQAISRLPGFTQMERERKLGGLAAANQYLPINLAAQRGGLQEQTALFDMERALLGDQLGAIQTQAGLRGQEMNEYLASIEAAGQAGAFQRGIGDQFLAIPGQAAQDPWVGMTNVSDILQSGTRFSTTEQPYYQNRAASAIGTGLAGAGTGAMIGAAVPGVGVPVGAGVGAGLGLLSGFIM